MSSTNGVSRAGLYLSIAASSVFLFGIIGSVFFVAFRGNTNTSDISSIYSRVSILETLVSQNNLKIVEQALSLNEIETQFAAQDIVHNLTRANNMRVESLLWQKVYGTVLPTDNAYYPTISNRRTK